VTIVVETDSLACGVLEPSQADEFITRRLKEALGLVVRLAGAGSAKPGAARHTEEPALSTLLQSTGSTLPVIR